MTIKNVGKIVGALVACILCGRFIYWTFYMTAKDVGEIVLVFGIVFLGIVLAVVSIDHTKYMKDNKLFYRRLQVKSERKWWR
jgi:Na+/phosphate symporter